MQLEGVNSFSVCLSCGLLGRQWTERQRVSLANGDSQRGVVSDERSVAGPGTNVALVTLPIIAL